MIMKKLMLLAAVIFCGGAMLAAVPAPIMDLDLTSGDVKTIKDLSPSNCKVLVNAPEKFTWGEGPNGQALQCTGDRSLPRPVVMIMPPAGFKFSKGFTMRFVFKTSDDYKRNMRYQLFQFGPGADKVSGISVFLYWLGIRCRYGIKSGDGALTPATVPLKASTWYDCVITYDTKNVIIYVNGKPVSQPTPAVIPDAKARYMMLGATAPSGSGYSFKGLISTAKLYDRALTAAEVSTLE